MGSEVSSGNRVFVSNRFLRIKLNLRNIQSIAKRVLAQLQYRKTDLNVVFFSDPALMKLNQKYLHHAWATDVLAFPHTGSERPRREFRSRHFLGEVLIASHQAKMNAKRFETSFENELMRYMIHGILHLKGFRDNTVRKKAQMSQKENELLAIVAHKIGKIL